MGKEVKRKIIALDGTIKTKSVDGERRIVFVASSSNQDRHYEKVNVASLRLPLKGGGEVVVGSIPAEGVNDLVDIPLMLNHSGDIRDVIGSVRSAYFESGELIFEAGISSRGVAQEMLTLIEEDHLSNSFSITMTDFDYNFEAETISNAEVVEVSLVYRGANKEARLLAIKSLLGETKMDEKSKNIEPTGDEKQGQTEATTATEAETQKTETETPKVESTEETAASEPKAEPVDESTSEVTSETNNERKEEEMSKEIAKDTVVEKAVAPTQDAPVSEKMDKVELTAKQFVAFVNKNHSELEKLNKIARETYKEKAAVGFLSTLSAADGGALVPSAELLADVYSVLGTYSTIATDLRVITLTEGDSLDIASIITDVIVSDVATEGSNKPVTKMGFAENNLALREIAGIAVITKKLIRQAAFDVYTILRDSFARAIARKRADMALTDAATGLVTLADVVEVEKIGAEVTWADVRKIPFKVPAMAANGAKYYISREALESLDGATDTTGRSLDIVTLSGDGLSGRFKNGFTFSVEDVLAGATSQVIFGNAKQFGILLRQANVEDQIFDTGTVVDDNVTHNLLQQNKVAERVAFYENVGYPIPGAFARLVEAGAARKVTPAKS